MEDDMSLDMVIKHIPAVRVAQVRYGGEEGIDFDALVDFGVVAFGTLFGALAEAGVDPEGPQFSYYEDRDDDTMLWPILAVPIGEQPFATTDEVETAVAPAIDAVVTMHRGAPTHDIVRPMYGQMARSAEDHGTGSSVRAETASSPSRATTS
jgi:hypothetical protein